MKKRHRTTFAAALTGVALLALTACGVTPDDTYDGAEDLRDALDGEGFRCTGGEASSLDSGFGEELTCDEGMTVAVWEEDYPEYADGPGYFAMAIAMFGEGHVLEADTWIIQSSNADLIGEIVPVFGGDYYGTDEDLQCEYNPNATDC